MADPKRVGIICGCGHEWAVTEDTKTHLSHCGPCEIHFKEPIVAICDKCKASLKVEKDGALTIPHKCHGYIFTISPFAPEVIIPDGINIVPEPDDASEPEPDKSGPPPETIPPKRVRAKKTF